MAQSVSGGHGEDTQRVESHDRKIVIDQVVIRERERVIDVPKVNFVEKTYEIPKITIREEETIKYIPREQGTTRYLVKDEETTRYVCKDVECERPVPIDREYERPIAKSKEYELPILVKKEIEVIEVKNIEQVKEYTKAIKELAIALNELEAHMGTLKKYTLAEEIVRVPRVEYFPVKVERIVWVDVQRERVTDAH